MYNKYVCIYNINTYVYIYIHGMYVYTYIYITYIYIYLDDNQNWWVLLSEAPWLYLAFLKPAASQHQDH